MPVAMHNVLRLRSIVIASSYSRSQIRRLTRKRRTDSNCGPSATNKTVVGGKCNITDTIAFDPNQQHAKSRTCTVGDDTTCDAVKGAGSNYVCAAEKISSGGREVTIGVCGYREWQSLSM